MDIYLVGGAVRDILLRRPAAEKDWLIVGATYQECLEKGYKPIAPDIPVFVHPDTDEEYAMARIEEKTGVGYKGFEFDYGPDIRLEQDLQRRDLTINALAFDSRNNLIDPNNYIEDLHQRRLRHIGDRFKEDPVRVIRLCSLYARLYDLGFGIVPETADLVRAMTSGEDASAEFGSISSQHLWTQLEKALSCAHPERYVRSLVDLGAAPLVFEPDMYTEKAISRLQAAAVAHTSTAARLGVWIAPTHSDQRQAFYRRYEITKTLRNHVERLDHLYAHYPLINEKPIPEILQLFKDMDAFGDPSAFHALTGCCHTLTECQSANPDIPQVQKVFLDTLLGCALRINRERILRVNIEGTPQMGVEIDKHRCAEMARARRYYAWSHLSVGEKMPN